jgi:hypothetical protein
LAQGIHVLLIAECKSIGATAELLPKAKPTITEPAPKVFWVHKPYISKQEMEAVNFGGMEPTVNWMKIKEI